MEAIYQYHNIYNNNSKYNMFATFQEFVERCVGQNMFVEFDMPVTCLTIVEGKPTRVSRLIHIIVCINLGEVPYDEIHRNGFIRDGVVKLYRNTMSKRNADHFIETCEITGYRHIDKDCILHLSPNYEDNDYEVMLMTDNRLYHDNNIQCWRSDYAYVSFTKAGREYIATVIEAMPAPKPITVSGMLAKRPSPCAITRVKQTAVPNCLSAKSIAQGAPTLTPAAASTSAPAIAPVKAAAKFTFAPPPFDPSAHFC